ncbi:hypothetical protein M3Y97_01085200 [Aphelenchoides bicaudatus]|nr:hypothetical protein M3Y97_01085200 [Aphelenchoides bicaudatus]
MWRPKQVHHLRRHSLVPRCLRPHFRLRQRAVSRHQLDLRPRVSQPLPAVHPRRTLPPRLQTQRLLRLQIAPHLRFPHLQFPHQRRLLRQLTVNIYSSTSTVSSSSTSTESTSSSSTSSTPSTSTESTSSTSTTTGSTTTVTITCDLFSYSNVTQFIFPTPTRTIYNIGDFVNVYCRYGLVHPNGRTLARFNCTSTGDWDSTPGAYGCNGTSLGLSTTLTPSAFCPQLALNLTNTLTPNSRSPVLSGTQPSELAGTIVAQICNSGFVHFVSQSPINVYVCQRNGNWTSNIADDSCVTPSG